MTLLSCPKLGQPGKDFIPLYCLVIKHWLSWEGVWHGPPGKEAWPALVRDVAFPGKDLWFALGKGGGLRS